MEDNTNFHSRIISAHQGQVDKAGKPYFEHAQAVCEIASDMILSWDEEYDDFLLHAKIVSYLHHVIEDTSMTIEDLWTHKIPIECILAMIKSLILCKNISVRIDISPV